jgi:RNA polymerase sigma-70 factor (ECF subfamily)
MTSEGGETLRVLRAQAGDREALGQLFEALQRPLYRYLLGLVGRPELAEDVLQEVFLLVHRKLRWLREPGLFRPWVYRIATREAFKHLRRERRWSDQAEDVELLAELPAQEPARPDGLVERLPAIAERLSPSSRAVLLLHYVQGLTIEEAAAVLGIPVGTAKSRLAYGLGALRRLLGPRL